MLRATDIAAELVYLLTLCMGLGYMVRNSLSSLVCQLRVTAPKQSLSLVKKTHLFPVMNTYTNQNFKLNMADSQAQADVEKAPDTQSRDEESRRPSRADAQPRPSDSKNEIIADKVIVLSFRNLQLKRIGALQDRLIELSMAREPFLPNHDDRVDETLRAYGG